MLIQYYEIFVKIYQFQNSQHLLADYLELKITDDFQKWTDNVIFTQIIDSFLTENNKEFDRKFKMKKTVQIHFVMLQYKNFIVQNVITLFSLNNISAEVKCLLYCYIHIIYQIIETFSNIFTDLSEKSLSTAENMHYYVYLLKSIIKFRDLNQKITDILHDKAITVSEYYSSAAEISFSELSTQVESS